jgi:hypothetical protein
MGAARARDLTIAPHLTYSRGVRRTVVIAAIFGGGDAAAQPLWRDDTAVTIGATAEWTNKAKLADIDGDGWLDIVLANGAGYAMPGAAERSRVFRNLGAWSGPAPYFEEITLQVLGGGMAHTRTIEIRDLDGDGDDDIVVGNTFGDPSRLILRDAGTWIDVTATQWPSTPVPQIGDIDTGDVDGDGDLDLVVADWGGDLAAGAPVRLYRNDGAATFVDATADAMPAVAVAWSWELDLVDVDGDFDLDLLVASKLGTGSFLFRNSGGVFSDDSAASLPQFTNNYEIEAMDIDADGDLDVATINDGTNRRDHIFVADTGAFTDGTATRLAGAANPPADDNVAAFVDADADGDADLIVGSLAGPDRWLINDGAGAFAFVDGALPDATPGTLGIAIGDIDRDGRPDIVDAQGEAAFDDRVYRATDQIAVDVAPPRIGPVAVAGDLVRARVHDHKTPAVRLDFSAVTLRYRGAADGEASMTWYGEHLWRAALPAPGEYTIQVCATDAAGNEACSAEQSTTPMVDGGVDVMPDGSGGGDPGGCGCRGGGGGLGLLFVVLASLAIWVRSTKRRSAISSAAA